MSNPQLLGEFWRWWGNPMEAMHDDHIAYLKKEHPKKHGVGIENIDYWSVDATRSIFGLHSVPDDGLLDSPKLAFYGIIGVDGLMELQPLLPALSFDDAVLKFSTDEWSKFYRVREKQYVRALISYNKSFPSSFRSCIDLLPKVCGSWQSVDPLSMPDRFAVLAVTFFRIRFPVFAKRYSLKFSNRVLNAVDSFEKQLDEESKSIFCDYLFKEMQRGAKDFEDKNEIPELDFDKADNKN